MKSIEKGLDTEGAAKVLGYSVRTLEAWRIHEIGPPYYKVMGRVYYDPDELVKWWNKEKEKRHE